MLRQRIGATVKIRGMVFFPLAAGGITFSCYEKGEPRAVCYSGRDRRYLFIPKQAHLTKQSASPFPTRSFPSRCGISPLLVCFSYLSLSIYSPLCLFISAYLSLSRPSCLFFSPRPPRLPTFLFYKIDRIDETEETRSMGRNTRI